MKIAEIKVACWVATVTIAALKDRALSKAVFGEFELRTDRIPLIGL